MKTALAQRTIPWSHIISPNGWGVVKPGHVVYFNPVQPLFQYRGMDLKQHAKTLSISVAAVVGLSQPPKDPSKAFTLYSAALDKVYYIVLSRASESMAPLGYLTHEIGVYCETSSGIQTVCDLSFLFGLNSALEAPEFAARTFRTLGVTCKAPEKEKQYTGTPVVKAKPEPACAKSQLMPLEREATWLAWVPGADKEMADPRWVWNMRKALDCLADPECLAALVKLVIDRSEKVRCYGAQLELWAPPPVSCNKAKKPEEIAEMIAKGEEEEGRFTEKARRALYVIGHWYPTQLITSAVR
ncbi:MAG: hypothetical protein QXI07_09010 [Pyrobaculum sp.]